MPKTIFREKRLTRRGCNFVIVNWFFYSAEQQLASRQKRAKKTNPTSPQIAKNNLRISRENLEWVCQNNFTSNDYFVTLTFAKEENVKTIKKLYNNFMARLRRIYKNQKIPLKYVSVAEFGEKNGRLHIHMLLNSKNETVSKEKIKKIWDKNGNSDVRTIKLTDDGLYGVAIYLGKSFLNGKLKRKWNCSHNCIHPNIEINYNEISSKSLSKIQNAKSEAELIRIIEKQYKGWHVVLGNPVKSSNEVTGSQNLRVKLMRNIPKKDIYEERELNMMPIFDSRKDVY